MDVHSTWNAGDLGCGELIAELRQRIKALEAKQILCLIATDAGAVEDIPAWCRLTGHRLRMSEPPQYFIERKDP